jgi:hypothetical protein
MMSFGPFQVEFTGNYAEYFGFATDVDAVVYLMLVNDMIHGLFPQAITIGEDVSYFSSPLFWVLFDRISSMVMFCCIEGVIGKVFC